MNLKSLVYFSLFGFYGIGVNAQNASEELLKINNKPFTVGEFERIYTKNLDLIKDEQQKNLESYLDLFVLYKLKVAKAYDLGLDKKSNYINEFDSHRKQLEEQYLTNQQTLDRLAKEAYERSIDEINASHIIFLADEFVTPSDSLKAYNKAIDVRNQILNGLSFETAAVQFSEDPSALTNKGNLGYFSALRMVYPFESGAYNTAVGEISMPIRSEFGYHLIKVNDRRPRKGKREISQIFISSNDSGFIDSEKLIIDDVYNKLENGVSFEELALQYSDDDTSKNNGGKLKFYEQGTFNLDGFDTAVYEIDRVGNYSKPFKSQQGWHIVKLLSEEPLPTFDQSKMLYLRKVQSDNRSRIIKDELVDGLKTKYEFKVNKNNYNDFVKFVEKNSTNLNFSKFPNPTKVLANFSDQKITANQFIDYIAENKINFAVISPIANGVNYCFDQFIANQIFKYYSDNLENEFPEFKYTVQEFREGLLLFDLLETEIWQHVKNDTLGYTNFYQSHLNEYRQEETVVGTIFEADKKTDIKKIHKYQTKYFGKKAEEISEVIDVDLAVSKKGKFTKGDKRLPKNYALKLGVSDIFEQDGKYYFVVADQYLTEKMLGLEDVKQQVIYEYQQEFEKQWTDNLKNDAIIEINKPVLEQLKIKYKQD